MLRGRISSQQMRAAADAADRFAAGELRTTNMQNLLIVNVPNRNAAALANELEANKMPVGGSPFWRGVVACSGSEFCKIAITETKSFSRWLVEELESGCPASSSTSSCMSPDVRTAAASTGSPTSASRARRSRSMAVSRMRITSAWAAPWDCISQWRAPSGIAASPARSRRHRAPLTPLPGREVARRELAPLFCTPQQRRIARVPGRRSPGRSGTRPIAWKGSTRS